MPYSARKGRLKLALASALGLAMVASPLAALSAQADPDGTGVVINEAYLDGGSSGAAFTNKFVELYNPTDAAIDLSGMSLQYRSASGTDDPTGVQALSGSIPANGYYLIEGTANPTGDGEALQTPDAEIGASFSGSSGTLFLANQTTALDAPATGSIAGAEGVVDVLGYGDSNTYESAPATSPTPTTSLNRANGADTDNNEADFSEAEFVTPTNAAGESLSGPAEEPDPDDEGEHTIAEIQGTTDASPYVGDIVETTGFVTATYPTGGFDGYYIQTTGSGGAVDASSHEASDAVFVYSPETVADVAIGDRVSVTGKVSEYYGLTEIAVSADGLEALGADAAAPPAPAELGLPASAEQRESLEGMLLAPQGDFTVTDNYPTNQYAEIELAAGSTPLIQPTVTAEPGTDAYDQAVADNAARSVTLNDGADIDFFEEQSTPLPYLSNDNPVRVGAPVTFTHPVIFDYRHEAWKFQPTTQLTVENAADVQPVTFENTRTSAPENVGGDITLATFNVLNYFSTLGTDLAGCTYYEDRAGNPTTISGGCPARGAADSANFTRQQDKIVAALNALDADVVGLEEIENSAAMGLGEPRDTALEHLTAALNTAAGEDIWAYVPSPAEVPEGEDVIRTAFIYKTASVEPVGESQILIGSAAFDNAREPLAQAFKAKGADDSQAFIAIVNHFKSKGSGEGDNADQGDGQGASNLSRTQQAQALVDFADSVSGELNLDKVFLLGDFNSYEKEDPIDVLTAAGYVDQGSKTGEHTYAYGGMVGSLDHVFASPAANEAVSGVDIWNINSVESVALEYSRYNNNVTDFYRPDVYRASDHDPILVGIDLTDAVDLNLLNINDFHGRIDDNTVKFAGTVEQLRAEEGDDSTLFLSAGDNVGASVFASAIQQDEPTIDVLNALELKASAVGNHEFDKGIDDITGRLSDLADFDYLGANVYEAGTENPVLDDYDVFTVNGVDVGVIGVVTQDTPNLVTKSGIAGLDFGDPVEAVNRVADQLTDGDPANGEADVVVAEYHEGAPVGTPDGGTLENQVAASEAFAEIVDDTSPAVDVIFTGHSHSMYAWEAPIPGTDGQTRPVLQTGSYGENIGQVRLRYDPATDEVVAYDARNVPRTTADDADLTETYPRVAEVKAIVDAALAYAEEEGAKPVGSLTADITTAYIGDNRDDRGSESTLGNLVADVLRDSLSDPDLGGAEIGVANPGGLRAELLYGDDGVITYAEANAVLPFLNNLWTTTLTGAQFKTVLEQQWQQDEQGNPLGGDDPFLNLGLSDNVTYTYDPTRELNDHITSIMVDGKPIDMDADYRIGSFSFLLQGGDHFYEFDNGTDTRDSGLVDRDAWIDYIGEHSPLSPSFDRRGVQVQGYPTGPVAPGETVTLDVSKLDLTSLGSPKNTQLSLAWNGTDLGTVPVTDGTASVTFTVPADKDAAPSADGAGPVGLAAPALARALPEPDADADAQVQPAAATSESGELVMVAQESGTTVRLPFTVGTSTGPVTPPNGGTTTEGGSTTGGGSNVTGELSRTGSDGLPALALSALLLVLGLAAVALRRRRTRRES